MLTKCIECGGTVSDKAAFCPHCGFSSAEPVVKPARTKPAKRMRLPNGFGQISLIKNQNLRNPYRVMVPDGKTETGKPKAKLLKPIAYFKTYNEAYAALTEYWRDPHQRPDITAEELHNMWAEANFKDVTRHAKYTKCEWPWKFCVSAYNVKVRDIRVYHIKACMEGEGAGETPTISAKGQIKTMWNQMLDYAIECDYVDKNYARAMKYSSPNANKESDMHKAYTKDEVNILMKNVLKNPYIDMTIVQCFSGWRPSEICKLKTSNVDIEKWTMTGGSKTKAGINRTVPIHTSIRPIMEHYYKIATGKNRDMLFVSPGNKVEITYSNFYKNLELQLSKLGMPDTHIPHDGRKSFVTFAKTYSVNEYAIKRIVGHVIDDLTERVYTERSIEWLADEIEKIKV